MPRMPKAARPIAALLLAWTATTSPAASAAGTELPLPPEVRLALGRAQVPLDAASIVVQEVDAPAPVLRWQAERPVNPASLFKLATTLAALDLLGPGYTWTTPVW